MTDETKKLFDAPWAIEEEAHLVWYCVIDSKDSVVANDVRDQKTVNRLSHLPELYDALKESINDKCRKCINDTRRRGDKSYINPYDFIELGCPYNRTCVTSDYLKLLRKVRYGK